MTHNEDHDIELNRAELARGLKFEGLEDRTLLAADLGNTIDQAIPLEPASDEGAHVAAEISAAADVDMYRVDLESQQTIAIEVNTGDEGSDRLDSHVRVFNKDGVELTSDSDASVAAGDDDFHSQLRFTPTVDGVYFIGVSSYANAGYDAVRSDGDAVVGDQHATGNYELNVSMLSGSDLAAGVSASTGSSIDVSSGSPSGSSAGLDASASVDDIATPPITSPTSAILSASADSVLDSSVSGFADFNNITSGFAGFEGNSSGFANLNSSGLGSGFGGLNNSSTAFANFSTLFGDGDLNANATGISQFQVTGLSTTFDNSLQNDWNDSVFEDIALGSSLDGSLTSMSQASAASEGPSSSPDSSTSSSSSTNGSAAWQLDSQKPHDPSEEELDWMSRA